MARYLPLIIAAWYAASTVVVFVVAVCYAWFMLEAELDIVAPLCEGNLEDSEVQISILSHASEPQISRS